MQKKVKQKLQNPQKKAEKKKKTEKKKTKLSELIVNGSLPQHSRRPPFQFVIKDADKKTQKVTEHNQGDAVVERIKAEAKSKLSEKISKSLFIKNIMLSKDLSTGEWKISLLDTNKGSFNIGNDINIKLKQNLIRKFTTYLKSTFENDIVEFLSEEDEE